MKHVFVDDNFSHITKDMERGLKIAVEVAGEVAVETAKATARQSSYHLAPVVESIHRTTAQRGDHSWFVLVFAPDFRANWFEKGTYASRKGAVMQSTLDRRSSGSGQARQARGKGNSGVRPQHFLRKGLLASRPVLLEQVRRALS